MHVVRCLQRTHSRCDWVRVNSSTELLQLLSLPVEARCHAIVVVDTWVSMFLSSSSISNDRPIDDVLVQCRDVFWPKLIARLSKFPCPTPPLQVPSMGSIQDPTQIVSYERQDVYRSLSSRDLRSGPILVHVRAAKRPSCLCTGMDCYTSGT